MLEKIRTEIDQIDQKIITLLGKRELKIAEIASIKLKKNLKIKDHLREKNALQDRYEIAQKHLLEKKYIKAIFTTIFNHSVSVQEKNNSKVRSFDKNQEK